MEVKHRLYCIVHPQRHTYNHLDNSANDPINLIINLIYKYHKRLYNTSQQIAFGRGQQPYSPASFNEQQVVPVGHETSSPGHGTSFKFSPDSFFFQVMENISPEFSILRSHLPRDGLQT